MELTNNKIVTFLILFLCPILHKTKLNLFGLDHVILFGLISTKKIDFNCLVYKTIRFLPKSQLNSRT